MSVLRGGRREHIGGYVRQVSFTTNPCAPYWFNVQTEPLGDSWVRFEPSGLLATLPASKTRRWTRYSPCEAYDNAK